MASGVAELRLLQALDCHAEGLPIEFSSPEDKFKPDLNFRQFNVF
jgi:hypothetical protein